MNGNRHPLGNSDYTNRTSSLSALSHSESSVLAGLKDDKLKSNFQVENQIPRGLLSYESSLTSKAFEIQLMVDEVIDVSSNDTKAERPSTSRSCSPQLNLQEKSSQIVTIRAQSQQMHTRLDSDPFQQKCKWVKKRMHKRISRLQFDEDKMSICSQSDPESDTLAYQNSCRQIIKRKKLIPQTQGSDENLMEQEISQSSNQTQQSDFHHQIRIQLGQIQFSDPVDKNERRSILREQFLKNRCAVATGQEKGNHVERTDQEMELENKPFPKMEQSKQGISSLEERRLKKRNSEGRLENSGNLIKLDQILQLKVEGILQDDVLVSRNESYAVAQRDQDGEHNEGKQTKLENLSTRNQLEKIRTPLEDLKQNANARTPVMLRKRKQSVKENIEKLLHSRDHSDAAENISVAEETANYQPISSPEKIVEEIEVLKKKFKKDKHGERIEILKHGDIIDMRGTSLESNTISILSRKLKSHKKATKNVKLSEEERAKRREEMKLLDQTCGSLVEEVESHKKLLSQSQKKSKVMKSFFKQPVKKQNKTVENQQGEAIKFTGGSVSEKTGKIDSESQRLDLKLLQLDILIEEKILLSKKAEQDQESKTAVGSKREKLKKIESVITRLKVLKSDLVSKALLRNALSDLLKKDQIRIHRISLVGDDVVVPEQSSVVFQSSTNAKKLQISTKLNKKEYFFDSIFNYTPEHQSFFEIYSLIQEAVLEKLENLDLTTEPIGHTILSLGQSSEIIVPTVSGNVPALKISARNQKESKELLEPKTHQSVKNQLLTKLLIPHDFRTKAPKSGLLGLILFFMFENLKKKYQLLKNGTKKYYLRVSSLEFHREKITDLLKGRSEKITQIKITEKESGLSVEGCIKKPIKTEVDILDSVDQINKRLAQIRGERFQILEVDESKKKPALTSFQKNRLVRANKTQNLGQKLEKELEQTEKKILAPDSLLQGHVLTRIEVLCPVDEKVNKKVASIDLIELGDFDFSEDKLANFIKYKETKGGQNVDQESADKFRDLHSLREGISILKAMDNGEKMYSQDKHIVDFLQSSLDLNGNIFSVSCLSRDIANLRQTKYLTRMTSTKF